MSPSNYNLHLILSYCCIFILTICQCVFVCLLVYLYFHCFFVLSCWCCCWYILSFLVDFYCLYMLREVPFTHSICLIFWYLVLNYISLAILRSFFWHFLFYIGKKYIDIDIKHLENYYADKILTDWLIDWFI